MNRRGFLGRLLAGVGLGSASLARAGPADPLRKMREAPEGRWAEDPFAVLEHWYGRLFGGKPPNPGQSLRGFVYAVGTDLCGYGTALVWPLRNVRGTIAECYHLPLYKTVPRVATAGFPQGSYGVYGGPFYWGPDRTKGPALIAAQHVHRWTIYGRRVWVPDVLREYLSSR